MKNNGTRSSDGFIMTIVIIIAALILLKFWFGFNIIDFLQSPKVAVWTDYIRQVVSFIWAHYLKDAFTAIFNFIVGLFMGLKK